MSYSPEQNAAAIAQGFTGEEDRLNNMRSSGGGQQSGSWNGGEVFNTARNALQQRYDSLISGLKGQQATETERQTVTTQNELGKRGILPSSGLAGQEMTNALNPITRGYSGLMSNAASDLNTGLANLALQQYQSQQSAQQQAQANEIARAQLANQTKETNYAINKPYYAPTTVPSGLDYLNQLAKLSLFGDNQPEEKKPTTIPNQVNQVNPTASFQRITTQSNQSNPWTNPPKTWANQ